MPTYYPAFLDLTGRSCVVIGGGEVAERKAGALLKAGARVTVVSPESTAELSRLAERGKIAWRRRLYQPGDLEGAWLAIAATDDPAANQAVAQEAEERHVLLNVVDEPALCGFIAPSVVQRGDLTIAISTSGKSPAMARRVREEMERWLPPEYGELLDLAAEVREALRQEGVRPDAAVWQTALSAKVLALVREGKRTEARDAVLRMLRGAAPAAR